MQLLASLRSLANARLLESWKLWAFLGASTLLRSHSIQCVLCSYTASVSGTPYAFPYVYDNILLQLGCAMCIRMEAVALCFFFNAARPFFLFFRGEARPSLQYSSNFVNSLRGGQE